MNYAGFLCRIGDKADLVKNGCAGDKFPIQRTSQKNCEDSFCLQPYPGNIVVIEWPAQAADIKGKSSRENTRYRDLFLAWVSALGNEVTGILGEKEIFDNLQSSFRHRYRFVDVNKMI
ncbi:MAG TPA: hypothetical protein VHN82_08630 [Methanoregula sp.]|nr:hypothetical protein [Methanoregula sp.]